MAEIPSDDTAGIEFIQNESNILLIAPHGVETEPFDDIGTAELTRKIAEKLQCSAIINTKFRRPTGSFNAKRNNAKPSLEKKVLNLAVVKNAEQLQDFINKIKSVINTDGLTHVFWIHSRGEKINNADCLIWYGQSKKNQKFGTAKQVIINNLIEQFKKNKIKVIKDSTRNKKEDMNQWFLSNSYTLEQVQSIRLSFNTTYCNNAKNIEKTAEAVSKAIRDSIMDIISNISVSDQNQAQVLSTTTDIEQNNSSDEELLTQEEADKVEQAYNDIKDMFVDEFKKAAQNAMLKTGQHIITIFYDNNYDEAAKKEYTRNKSLKQLFSKFTNNTGANIPKKTWLYSAIDLAIADNQYKEYEKLEDDKKNKVLSAWNGHLTISHKIKLIHAKLPEDTTDDLIIKTAEQHCKVAELQKLIDTIKGKKDVPSLSLLQKDTFMDEIKKYEYEDLKELESKLKEKIKLYTVNMEHLKATLKEKKSSKK